jgi:hypothetical protein
MHSTGRFTNSPALLTCHLYDAADPESLCFLLVSAAAAADLLLVRRCSPSAMDRAKETGRELIALLTLAFLTGDVSRPTFHV